MQTTKQLSSNDILYKPIMITKLRSKSTSFDFEPSLLDSVGSFDGMIDAASVGSIKSPFDALIVDSTPFEGSLDGMIDGITLGNNETVGLNVGTVGMFVGTLDG